MLTPKSVLAIGLVLAVLEGLAIVGVIYGAYKFGVYQGWFKALP